MRYLLLSVSLLLAAGPVAQAAQVPISAAQVQLNPEQEVRAMRLNEMLKCPVCKNQSLAASSSFISEEMKRNIRMMVLEGKTDQEILDFFVERYTEWVLLAPPKTGINWILYAVPPIFALTVGFVLWRRFRPAGAAAPAAAGTADTSPPDSAAARAQQWLEKQDRL